MVVLLLFKENQSLDLNGEYFFDLSVANILRIDPKTKSVARRPFTVALKATSIAQTALKLKVTQDKKEIPHVISWKSEGTSA